MFLMSFREQPVLSVELSEEELTGTMEVLKQSFNI